MNFDNVSVLSLAMREFFGQVTPTMRNNILQDNLYMLTVIGPLHCMQVGCLTVAKCHSSKIYHLLTQ